MRLLHVDHLLRGDAPPLADAAVVVEGDGTIDDVGAAAEILPRHAGLGVERVRGVAFPGLVNAHTHLELSALRGVVTGGRGFVPWLDGLVAARLEAAPDHDGEAIARAVADLEHSGTSAVGEVSNRLGTVHALARAGIAGVVYHEVFGVAEDAAAKRFAALADEVTSRVGAWPSEDLAYAPAAHTLYSTHPAVVRAAATRARASGVATTLHLLEHPSERAALEEGRGPMVEWIRRRVRGGPGFAWPLAPPLAYAESLGSVGPHVVLVHLTDARPEELARIAALGAKVVLCPRSNLFIEARIPPLLALRAAGIEAGLGTDSLASNASLDVLAEARALADRFSSVPAADLVRMATWGGASALGRADLGRVTRGARPGLVAVEGDAAGDPAGFLLRNHKAPRRWLARRAPR